MRSRSVLLFTLVLGLLPIAGCFGSGDKGMFNLYATDAPDNIGDFSSLTVTVTKIVLKSKEDKTSEFTPSDGTFDLTKLTGANTTQLFGQEIDVGNYTKLELEIQDAKGTLKADGKQVDVKAPSGRLFVNTPFEVAAGTETHFVFDIQVHMEGNGKYSFKPNASGSGPRSKEPKTIDA